MWTYPTDSREFWHNAYAYLSKGDVPVGIMDTLKGMLGGKADMVTDKADAAIDAAADKADDVTGGKASGIIDGAADKAKDAVDEATEQQ
jgi:hypothetical protein